MGCDSDHLSLQTAGNIQHTFLIITMVVHDTAFQAPMKIKKKSSRVQIQRAAETNEVFSRPERVIGQLCFLFGKLIASVDHSIQP